MMTAGFVSMNRHIAHRLFFSMYFVSLLFFASEPNRAQTASTNNPSDSQSKPTAAETRIELKLCTGSTVTGVVVKQNDHGVVLDINGRLYVFGWIEVEVRSAITARKKLLAERRGGWNKVLPEDLYAIGEFALSRHRKDLAMDYLEQAKRADASLVPKVRDLVVRYRETEAKTKSSQNQERSIPPLPVDTVETETTPTHEENESNEVDPTAAKTLDWSPASGPSESVREQVLEKYREFGAKVREVLGDAVVAIETEHFLIWTDWEESERQRLGEWCENMYRALARQFRLDESTQVFLTKCPVFCFRTKSKFQKFARYFDGFDGKDAIGYTRSIEKNGHVHVVLLRQGVLTEDFDRFACTLTHEGTHAFVHRLFSSRLIPHWVNEGLAEYVANEVLGATCPGRKNAEMLSEVLVERKASMAGFLRSVGPIEVHDYPLAQSIVEHLVQRDGAKWIELVRSLKEGAPLEEALTTTYDGMNFAGLEKNWRDAVEKRKSVDQRSPND